MPDRMSSGRSGRLRLYHYTCKHMARKIGKRGVLRPFRQPMLNGREVVWLTDMAAPDVRALGLTQTMLSCDRTSRRYVTDSALPQRWLYSQIRHLTPQVQLDLLEFGRSPGRWWISTVPIKAKRALRGKNAG